MARSWRLLTVGAAALTLAAAASACETHDGGGASGGSAATDPMRYAYVSDNELALVTGSTVTARTAAGGQGVEVQFTEDGRFAYTVVGGTDDGSNRIVALDTTDGSAREVTCECGRAVWAGGSRLAFLDGQGALATVDLAAGAPSPQQSRAIMPGQPQNSSNDPPVLLLGVTDRVLVAVPNSPSNAGGPQQLAWVFLDGRTLPRVVVRRTDSQQAVGDPAASVATVYGGPRVAFTLGSHWNGCVDSHGPVLMDPATGEITWPDYSAVIGDPGDVQGLATRDVWFGNDGRLYATMATWRCGEMAADWFVPVRQPSRWRLDGNAWVLVDPGPVFAVRTLTPDSRVVLVGEDVQLFGSGSLYLEANGSRVPVATNVWSIATPPASPPVPEISESRPPNEAASGPPECEPRAFFTPSPDSALLGYRCRGNLAVAVTASAMGGVLYGGRGQTNAVIYVARTGAWVAVASSSGGLYVPASELTNAGLDWNQVAQELELEIVTDTIYVIGLDCNGQPLVSGRCA